MQPNQGDPGEADNNLPRRANIILPPIPANDQLLNEKQLARRWAITPRMLQSHRVSGKLGLKHVVLGTRLVRYRLSDVLAFEAANERFSTSEKGS